MPLLKLYLATRLTRYYPPGHPMSSLDTLIKIYKQEKHMVNMESGNVPTDYQEHREMLEKELERNLRDL